MPVFVETIEIGAPAPNNNDDSDDLDSPALPTRDNTDRQNSESDTGATKLLADFDEEDRIEEASIESLVRIRVQNRLQQATNDSPSMDIDYTLDDRNISQVSSPLDLVDRSIEEPPPDENLLSDEENSSNVQLSNPTETTTNIRTGTRLPNLYDNDLGEQILLYILREADSEGFENTLSWFKKKKWVESKLDTWYSDDNQSVLST